MNTEEAPIPSFPLCAAVAVVLPSAVPTAAPAEGHADNMTFAPNPAGRADTGSAETAAGGTVPAGTLDARPIGLATPVLVLTSAGAAVACRVPDTVTAGPFTIYSTCADGRKIKGTHGIERSWVGTPQRWSR